MVGSTLTLARAPPVLESTAIIRRRSGFLVKFIKEFIKSLGKK